jgi:cellulose synthase/poly-beta-1,6-N-acetylglucosamine synthase-like glycosyltransferase
LYGSYYLLVLRNSKREEYLRELEMISNREPVSEELPVVSVLVPAHNEERFIPWKLRNISELRYPRDKIELVLIDDCSTDRTGQVGKASIEQLGLQGKVLRNERKMGVNVSYNIGVQESRGDLILTTDADVMMERDALLRAVVIIQSLPEVGGVSGGPVQIADHKTRAFSIEKSYRRAFDSMLIAESALYSTFPGHTALTVFRRSAFSPLPSEYGSSDGNLSFAIIRNGMRFIYSPNLVFYELVTLGLVEQRRQKIRRAARLIQSTLANRDMAFNGDYESFGNLIFPMRLAMTFSPFLFFLGASALLVSIFMISWLTAGLAAFICALVMYWGMKTDTGKVGFLASAIIHEFYLLLGLLSARKTITLWSPPRRSRQPEDLANETEQ